MAADNGRYAVFSGYDRRMAEDAAVLGDDALKDGELGCPSGIGKSGNEDIVLLKSVDLREVTDDSCNTRDLAVICTKALDVGGMLSY